MALVFSHSQATSDCEVSQGAWSLAALGALAELVHEVLRAHLEDSRWPRGASQLSPGRPRELVHAPGSPLVARVYGWDKLLPSLTTALFLWQPQSEDILLLP